MTTSPPMSPPMSPPVSRRRPVALLAVLATLLALPALLAAAPSAQADTPGAPTPARVSGGDRFQTAAAVAHLMYPHGADTVVLARGDEFADSLAAAGLAGQVNGPVLLTAPGSLPGATTDALQDLGADTVYIIGGTAAIDDSVEAELATSYDVTRLAGEDRFATARTVAREQVHLGTIAAVDGERSVFIVNGRRFADAVAASAPAASGESSPILLVTDAPPLPIATLQALLDLDIGHAYVIGGDAVVNDDVVAELHDRGIATDRIAGADRSLTAAAVARAFMRNGTFDGGVVHLARGDGFADALAAGPLAARLHSPVVLTHDPSHLGQGAADYLYNTSRSGPEVTAVRAVGGRSAVSVEVLSRAIALATPSPGSPDYVAAPSEPLTASAGSAVDVAVRAFPDGGPLVGPMTASLVPCGSADVVGSGDDTVTPGADGTAPEGQSDTAAAAIAVVNGTDIPDQGMVRGVDVVDGAVSLRLFSSAADCAAVFVYDDADGDGSLGLDSSGRPVENYAVFKVTWTAG